MLRTRITYTKDHVAYIARPSDCGRRLVTLFDFPVTRHREQAKVNSMANNTYLGY
jgi:hypothetical protein